MPVSARTYERWSEKSMYTILIDELHLSFDSKNQIRCTSWGALRFTTCHVPLSLSLSSSLSPCNLLPLKRVYGYPRRAHLACPDNRHTGAFIMSGSGACEPDFLFSLLPSSRPEISFSLLFFFSRFHLFLETNTYKPERAIFAYINHGRRGWHGNCFFCGNRASLPFGRQSSDVLLSWEILYLSRNAELNRIW